MYELQRYSPVHRPGKAADGPPYAKPGAWVRIQGFTSKAAALEAMERMLHPFPGNTTLPRERARVKLVKSGTRVAVATAFQEQVR